MLTSAPAATSAACTACSSPEAAPLCEGLQDFLVAEDPFVDDALVIGDDGASIVDRIERAIGSALISLRDATALPSFGGGVYGRAAAAFFAEKR